MPYSAREVGERVLGAGRVDQVGGEQRVVGRVDAERLRVVARRARRRAAPRAARARSRRRRRRATPARPSSAAKPTLPGPSSSSPSCQRHVDSGHLGAARRAAPRRACRAARAGRGTRSGGRTPSAASGRAGRGRAWLGSKSSSRSRRIVASSFETRACSACSTIAFARAGESSAACSITASSEPYGADQLPGRLVADPGDARDVVGGVALEPDEVGDLVGPDAVAGLDAAGRVDLHVGDAARGHHQADVRPSRAGRRRGRSRRRRCAGPPRSARVASVAITSSASQPSNSRLR